MELFKSKKELIDGKEKWEILVEKMSLKTYGDLVLHQDIMGIIKLNYGTTEYYSVMNKAKNELMLNGIWLHNIKGQGYRILEPDVIIEKFEKGIVQSGKKVSRNYKMLKYAPVKDMSMQGQERYNSVCEAMHRINATIAASCVEVKLLVRPERMRVRSSHEI